MVKERIMQEKRRHKQISAAYTILPEKPPRGPGSESNVEATGWLAFLAYLAYLFVACRAVRSTQTPLAYTNIMRQFINALRLLIVIVSLVLIVVAVVAAGAPEEVARVLSQWPFVP
jgi:hypothetical protein